MNPNDPRSVRSDEALTAALYRLGALKPIESVGVDELCAEAGVSRATFYRRARTPADLLAADLKQLLETTRVRFLANQASTTGSELLQEHYRAIAELTSHISEFAQIYANSLGVDHSALGLLLRTHMEETVRGYVESRRDQIVLPRTLAEVPWERTREILTQHYAQGTFGLVRVWLRLPADQRDRAALAEWLLALAPAWNRRLMDLGGGRV